MSRHDVVSPIPGIFYRKPDPNTPDYVQVGQTVAAGDTIGLVEVMKSFHQIPAGVSGTVVDVVADSESVVDAGQALVVIEVDG
ncbi:acetyl-CoA carboxylase [Saccharopolyspora sp. WRP15-2]|uniref:Biotin carboxyl carrier protein of acetyl-CoA carboxylase n=2 Tax=Saccharopolyspora TaxID=1835 RepID=A0ABT4USH2_9PSEU|nr:acetyl-CoA carboxylase [Saccharopolyspora oryzae]MDA3624659.1 acetyl-CoA carboxylase [Saccharopolyspora oryzae]